MSKKESLVRIPKANKPPRTAAADKRTEPDATGPDRTAEPDLSHIAPGLRALAKPIADLQFMAGNAVDHPADQVEELRALLGERGQLEPLIVNVREGRKPVVIGGNGRLQAMLAMGWTHAAVNEISVDDVTAEQIAIELNFSPDGRTVNRPNLDAALARIQNAKRTMPQRCADMLGRIKKEHGTRQPAQPAAAQPPPAQPAAAPVTCPSCGHTWSK